MSAGADFHVTYWMFYPFSEGKTICVLDLGFFGSWPIPTVAGRCIGTLKEYGSHIGDWEHMSLYFKVKYSIFIPSLSIDPFPRYSFSHVSIRRRFPLCVISASRFFVSRTILESY